MLFAPVTYKISGVEDGGKLRKETTKQDSPHWILCDLSGLDCSSRHIDEEQLFFVQVYEVRLKENVV